MTHVDLLDDLVLRWEEAAEEGRPLAVAELCRDHPHLAAEVSRRIGLLKRMGWLDPNADEPAPAVLAGRFRLDRRIGQGGHGEVWRAFDLTLQRTVAVKLPRPGGVSGDMLSEARRGAALRHPGIVTVHEVGDSDGQPFIVSDFVDGEDLGSRLARGPLPPADAAGVVARAAEALHHAHQSGVVHRDVTPANVLLARDGRVLVTDFGLACPERAGGTATHMAPEQVRGGPADARSDVWALGVVLYEAATGRLPFRADTRDGLRTAILAADPPPPSRIDPLVPDWLSAVCLRCLSEPPAERYSTAAALAAALVSGGRRTADASLLGWRVAAVAAAVAVGLAVVLAVRDGPTLPGPQEWVAAADDLGRLAPGERERVLAAQREAAEWVIGLGGTVRVRATGGNPRTVGWVADLPVGPFLVTAVHLTDAPVVDADLARLRWLPALESLRLERTRLAGDGFVHLSALPRLRELDLTGTPLTDGGVAGVALPPSLERLSLRDSRVVDGYGFVAGCRSLSALDLSRSSVSDAGVAHLAGLGNLRDLDLSGTDITDAALPPLAGLTRLGRLRLDRTWVRGPGLKALADLPELAELGLMRTHLTDDGVEGVTAPPNLRLLQTDGVPVSGAWLVYVEAHPTLERLGMPGTAVGDDALPRLLRLPRLKHLNLRQTRATSAGLRALAEAPALEELLTGDGLLAADDEAHLRGRRPRLKIIP